MLHASPTSLQSGCGVGAAREQINRQTQRQTYIHMYIHTGIGRVRDVHTVYRDTFMHTGRKNEMNCRYRDMYRYTSNRDSYKYCKQIVIEMCTIYLKFQKVIGEKQDKQKCVSQNRENKLHVDHKKESKRLLENEENSGYLHVAMILGRCRIIVYYCKISR